MKGGWVKVGTKYINLNNAKSVNLKDQKLTVCWDSGNVVTYDYHLNETEAENAEYVLERLLDLQKLDFMREA